MAFSDSSGWTAWAAVPRLTAHVHDRAGRSHRCHTDIRAAHERPDGPPLHARIKRSVWLPIQSPDVAVDTHFSKRKDFTIRRWEGCLNPGAELLQQLRLAAKENAQQ
jgi:hypothetical protein